MLPSREAFQAFHLLMTESQKSRRGKRAREFECAVNKGRWKPGFSEKRIIGRTPGNWMISKCKRWESAVTPTEKRLEIQGCVCPSVCDLCRERSHRIYTLTEKTDWKNVLLSPLSFSLCLFLFISQFEQLDNTH